MLLEIRSSRQAVFLKIMFFKTSQVSQESICDGVIFSWSCMSSYLQLYLKGRHHKRFPVNMLT